ncbi:MAG: hypothetical protein U0271_43060 [Polyangiaceae bacterium]
MNVRLFGYDVEITGGFWVSAFLIGVMVGALENWPIMAVVVLGVLLSVLIHEFGHALAYRAFGIHSTIRLHFMGGATFGSVVLPLSRPKQVIVSLAGPFAGFALAGLSFVALQFVVHPGFTFLAWWLVRINIGWSLLNLAPVLPLDGGHVVEQVLGPRRYRITLGISAVAGALLAIYFFVYSRSLWAGYIFGSAAVQAFLQLREVSSALRDARVAADDKRERGETLAPATQAALAEAVRLLDEEGDPARALAKARDVVDGREVGGRPKARAVSEALTIAGRAELALGDVDAALQTVQKLGKMAQVDPALAGGLALAQGNSAAARRLLEGARASGDNRKAVFGPLIQALLLEREPARAGALALDNFEALSTEDTRTIARMVFEQGTASEGAARTTAHWAARLYEAVFAREHASEDAFEAARAFAQAGESRQALELLRQAVQAGFSDARRAYDDKALVGLDELDSVLPRPA